MPIERSLRLQRHRQFRRVPSARLPKRESLLGPRARLVLHLAQGPRYLEQSLPLLQARDLQRDLWRRIPSQVASPDVLSRPMGQDLLPAAPVPLPSLEVEPRYKSLKTMEITSKLPPPGRAKE